MPTHQLSRLIYRRIWQKFLEQPQGTPHGPIPYSPSQPLYRTPQLAWMFHHYWQEVTWVHQEHKPFTRQELGSVPNPTHMGPSSTRHTCTPAHIAQLYHPLHGPNCPPTIMWGHTQLHLVSCLMWGCLPFQPYICHNMPHTPNTQTPQTPLTSISVVPSVVSTHFYLCSFTFSHRPDEVASVLGQ